jgi:hypothetical protein
MTEFFNAYLTAFLQGNYRDLAKELLTSTDKPRYKFKCKDPHCFNKTIAKACTSRLTGVINKTRYRGGDAYAASGKEW